MEMSSGQEKTVKTLRRELEGWREVLVILHSVLHWEKNFYPAISAGVVTFIFLLIWDVDLSILTLFSVIGIIITLLDYVVPQMVPIFCSPNHWTGSQERKYEQIVSRIAEVCTSAGNISSTLASMKSSRPTLYFFTVTFSLLFFAWIGNIFNNLFLTYLIVLFFVMLPGLKQQKIFQKYFASALQMCSGFLKNLSSDKAETKKE